MTIQEAIKSGKPFKRGGWNTWAMTDGPLWVKGLFGLPFTPTVQDILATDWEVKD